MLMRFEPLNDRLRPAPAGTRTRPTPMPMDAYRDGERVHVRLDLPGVAADDLDVTVEHRTLTVTAARSWEPGDDVVVLAGERSQGRWTRTLQLGDDLDVDGLEADYVDGVLHVTIPVARSASPRKVEIGAKAIAA